MPEAVITGLGPVAPNGIGSPMFWEAISTGRSGIRHIKSLEDSKCSCQIAGEIPAEWIDSRSQDLPEWLPDSKSCKFSLLAAVMALEDAGLALKDFAHRIPAIYMGASNLDMEVCHNEYQSFFKQRTANPGSLFSASPHTPATVIAHYLKNSRNVITISTACTSGAVCVHFAANSILREEADVTVAGGVDASLSPIFMNAFCSAGLSPSGYNDRPEEASRPFDKDRESGILSEGAGVVVLEEKTRALRRNAKMYASFNGGGMSNVLTPSAMKSSFYEAMATALTNARLSISDIDYISACGTGHRLMDHVETKAIKELFGSRAYNLPVSSIKSMIGNPGAAAGPLQIIATVLAMQNSYIPPTINLIEPEKKCDLDYVPIKGRIARVKRAMINIRGLGGSVSSLIISKV